MKNLIRNILLPLFCIVASAAYGASPKMDVAVSDAGGKSVFKGKTGGNGTFATGNLQPGKYVVQLNGNGAGVKGGKFFVVLSAGKQKVTADAVAGEKFAAGGVAMKIEVAKASNITGQVSNAPLAGGKTAAEDPSKVKMVNGKKYVWVGPETGSHLGGRWVEEGSPEARRMQSMGADGVRSLQDRGTDGGLPGN